MNKILKTALLLLSALVLFFGGIFYYFFCGRPQVAENITWGVDFSQMQAGSLKLDWKEAYSAIIDDLGAKNIKLHTQWNWVEGEQDRYYFSDIDWQIEQAEQKNVKIIFVLGMKTGRWPECHIPKWAQAMQKEQQQQELLQYIKDVVLRYKNSGAIAYWQAENEPLFKFGQCPDWYYQNDNFLKKEVDLIKELDSSRQIIVSDSGEQSLWFGAAKAGDIVGVTIYRRVWAHVTDLFGFKVLSFLNPATYYKKAEIIQKVFGKKVICIELQAEPWAPEPFSNISLEEQEETMNFGLFKENVEFARQTGFDTFYFWGVEWWYWLKETQNRPEIWNAARELFWQK